MDTDLAKRERRCGIDRRDITYDLHIPERRSGKDRRSGTVRLNSVRFPMSSKQIMGPERREGIVGKDNNTQMSGFDAIKILR
jgi:hypothetical protein